MAKKKRIQAGELLQGLSETADLLRCDLADAIRDVRLDGSVAELEELQSVCAQLAAGASDVTLTLFSTVRSGRYKEDIDRMNRERELHREGA